MDFKSDKQDLIEIVEFQEKLLAELVEKIPDEKPQFRRVWRQDIQPKFAKLKGAILGIKGPNQEDWKALQEVGLTDEQLRLKYNALCVASEKNSEPKILKFADAIMGSLTKAFPYLEAAYEFGGFVYQSYEMVSGGKIQTLFPPGKPIPYTDSKPPEIQG